MEHMAYTSCIYKWVILARLDTERRQIGRSKLLSAELLVYTWEPDSAMAYIVSQEIWSVKLGLYPPAHPLT